MQFFEEGLIAHFQCLNDRCDVNDLGGLDGLVASTEIDMLPRSG